MRTPATAKVAAISCTHSPYTPPEVVDWLLGVLSNTKGLTHFGHLGDVFEARSASVHPDSNDGTYHSLEDEYEHASTLLSSIREVLPRDCTRWINKGNHDANLEAMDPRRIPKELRSLVHFSRHPEFGEEFRRWKWVPYEKNERGVYNVGQVAFYHGFDAGVHSDETEGLQMLNAMGDAQQQTFRLMVRGHTHRPVQPTQMKRTAKIPLPFWYTNVGTCGPAVGRSVRPEWAVRRDTSLWGAAVLIVECRVDRPSRLVGKCWDAELIRMPK